jgi:hypothetical protein
MSSLLPPIGGPSDPFQYFILFESVASATHGLEVRDVMVRWVAGYHVVNSPIVTLKVFTTSSTDWFEYGLSVGSSLYPFFTAMPVSHLVLQT